MEEKVFLLPVLVVVLFLVGFYFCFTYAIPDHPFGIMGLLVSNVVSHALNFLS